MPPTRLSGNAIDNSKLVLDELVAANSIPLNEEAAKCGKIRTCTGQTAR